MNCRHCGNEVDDPWELTGLLDHTSTATIYPLTLIGEKGRMDYLHLHRDCISGYFKYLSESPIGDLCQEQQDCAVVAAAPSEGELPEQPLLWHNVISVVTTSVPSMLCGRVTITFARNVTVLNSVESSV